MSFNVNNSIDYFSEGQNTRHRTTLTSEHIKGLEALFKEDNKPSNQVRCELAKKLGLTERNVQIWFQNRRTKARSNGELKLYNNNKLKRNNKRKLKYNNNNNNINNENIETSSTTNPSPKSSDFDVNLNYSFNNSNNNLNYFIPITTATNYFNYNYINNQAYYNMDFNSQSTMSLTNQPIEYYNITNQTYNNIFEATSFINNQNISSPYNNGYQMSTPNNIDSLYSADLFSHNVSQGFNNDMSYL